MLEKIYERMRGEIEVEQPRAEDGNLLFAETDHSRAGKVAALTVSAVLGSGAGYGVAETLEHYYQSGHHQAEHHQDAFSAAFQRARVYDAGVEGRISNFRDSDPENLAPEHSHDVPEPAGIALGGLYGLVMGLESLSHENDSGQDKRD